MPENTNNFIKIPNSVDNALYNLTDAPTKSIGSTLSDIWSIVFGSVSQLAKKSEMRRTYNLELFREELYASVSHIPEDKKVEPSIQITGQALENSKYCIDEPELRRMFTALITNSMNSDYSSRVHPAFAETIKQMSVLDAIIIRLFKLETTNGFPVCKYLRSTGNGSFIVLAHHLMIPNDKSVKEATTSFEVAKSLTVLERLGLIQVDYTMQISDDSEYDKFLNNQLCQAFKAESPDEEIVIRKGISTLTLFGNSFVQSCVAD